MSILMVIGPIIEGFSELAIKHIYNVSFSKVRERIPSFLFTIIAARNNIVT